MNFLDLHDDVKVIIAKHLTSDNKINKIFMTKPDDDLQKILFGEVKDMKIDFHIEDMCIDFQKNKIEFHDEINFFKTNYHNIFKYDRYLEITVGNENVVFTEEKVFYNSYNELKKDVKWLCKYVFN